MENSYIIPRNILDLNKILLLSDENNEDFKNNREENNNSLRNNTFEKMILQKSSSNKCLLYNKKNSANKHTVIKESLKNKKIKENNFNNINFAENKIKNYNYYNNNPNAENNPINKYFQKRHMKEIEKLDNLRQDKFTKEISEVRDRPVISCKSKEIYQKNIQCNRNVFDRLIEPSQVNK